MVRGKKMIKEEAQVEEKQEVNETEAAETLHPGSRKASGEKTMEHKSAMLAKMIGASASMDSEELCKHYQGMMAWAKKAGHGPGAPDASASNKATLATKPSGAGHNQSYNQSKDSTPHLNSKQATSGGGTQIHHPNEGDKNLNVELESAIKADLATIFEGTEGINEEFKTKFETLFEAAVEARVSSAVIALSEEYAVALEEEVDGIADELITGLDQYLDYVTEEWMKENQVAVESSLRNEMAAEFVQGLTKLLKEFNVNISDDQVEIVDAMASKIDELETRLNDLISEKSELETVVAEAEKANVMANLTEGLTLVEAEKLRELAEGIEADDLEGFTKKVQVLKESNFVTKSSKKAEALTESLEEVDENNKPAETEEKLLDPVMKKYASAISRTTVKY